MKKFKAFILLISVLICFASCVDGGNVEDGETNITTDSIRIDDTTDGSADLGNDSMEDGSLDSSILGNDSMADGSEEIASVPDNQNSQSNLNGSGI